MPSRSRSPQRLGRWLAVQMLPLVVLLVACSSSTAAASVTHTTPKASASATPSATSQPVDWPTVTPISGDYSVYVDPTWGYSFEYPSNWVVYPSIGTSDNGAQESSVNVMQPFTTDVTHPAVYLIVRATNNYQDYFVQTQLCNQTTTATVDGFPAVVLDTWGGSPTTFYISPALGRTFFAKGLAFEIWLQSSARESYAISSWMSYAQPIFKHVLSTFTVGSATKNVSGC